ncbi:MAG: shikimate dehydrogenase [delta proteobacterium ML8_F1]|nr:MAG: shikimate dehydrogenase [delta proteobacterium ML8_F1]
MINRITGKTRLIGLLGSPIRHSVSPMMHNTAFEHLGLDYVYLVFEVDHDNLDDAVKAMKTLDVAGFNVTMPNKQKVIPLLDEITESARIIDAVNAVKNERGRLIGDNTDGKGFVMSLTDEGVAVKDKDFVIIGAGSAARSIGIQLALDGARSISIFNRSKEPASYLKEVIEKNIPSCDVQAYSLEMSLLKEVVHKADVLINATNVGMGQHQDKSVITEASVFHRDLVVADVIYSPPFTKTLQMADAAGCKTINGLGMIIGQGALAFKFWTGEDMPADLVKEVILNQ